MKILHTIKYVFENLLAAAKLSLVIILLVVAAEGMQHVVEYYLGMYESRKIFNQLQGNPVRIGFGILKAVMVISACYIIPRNLAKHRGPPPKYGSFRADMIRKLWDPRMGMSGFLAMLLLAMPLIFLHYKLSYLAMSYSATIPFLIADSVLIGILALTMGTSVWAGDQIEFETQHGIRQG